MDDGSPASGYHLGLDLGTTSVKVALLDAVTKKCVQAYREETAAVINETKPEFAEQNVQAIVAKLENAVKKIPAELLAKVRYVGICGQMHGCVLWNSESISNWLSTPYAQLGETSRLITWEDGRCSSDFLSSLPRLKNYHAVSSGFGCATIFWLARHRPECFRVMIVRGPSWTWSFVCCVGCRSRWCRHIMLSAGVTLTWKGQTGHLMSELQYSSLTSCVMKLQSASPPPPPPPHTHPPHLPSSPQSPPTIPLHVVIHAFTITTSKAKK